MQKRKFALKSLILLLVLSVMMFAGCGKNEPAADGGLLEVPPEDDYSFTNPEENKAQPDSGIVIDGVLDEKVYQDNNWLYLHNDDGGNNVNIAMTSYYGEKGMYFVFDVTESVPIFVNPDRQPYMNSCIELYLAPSYVTTVQDSDIFEIDLLPTGDMVFKRSNGKYGYNDVTTTSDIMAVLGATTKGGEVNTPECKGYNLELFIPWDYMRWLGLDTAAMKDSFVFINPAHITSNNLTGTNTDLDRYWYFYAQQNGADFSEVSQYFRFNEDGVMGAVPVSLGQGENCTLSAQPSVIPGMTTQVTIQPKAGHALTSILVDGEEQIQHASFDENGNVILTVRGSNEGVNVSAKAKPVTEGKKTLAGKVILNNLQKDDLEGLILTYTGPQGEKPLDMDAQGRFELKDMEQGYYVLTAEKEGYRTVKRGIFLNQDMYTELVLEYDLFFSTKGTCFVMDEQNDGVMQKFGGTGHVLSNTVYDSFTYRLTLRYDPELAQQGTSDPFVQQRSGMRIKFSNGKYWHIDLLKEGNKYILQYAKHTGDDSVFNWKTIDTLLPYQVEQYTSEAGIELTVMRQANYAAIWLGNTLIKVEKLNAAYAGCTAQVGMEAWIANREIMDFPFSLIDNPSVNVVASPFHIPTNTWDISGQYAGKVTKFGVKGVDTWLDSVLNANDITTIAQDLSPETKDYSMIYIFKFSNGEQLRIRLNHTDDDGKYRIQSMARSTVAPAWKNGYTLTDEQAEKVMNEGIAYRVQILGTTAHVYLDGTEVCTYDLSKVIESGKPSGIDKATAKISLRLDGNIGQSTVIPFKMVDSTKDVQIFVGNIENGTVVSDKEIYKLGETVTLTLKGDEGYYYTGLFLNGEKVEPNWDGTYSFVSSENIYNVSATFTPGSFAENADSAWTLTKQALGLIKMESHDTGDSGWLSAAIDGNDISTLVKDADPDAKNFSMIYHFTFSNGETLRLRLNHTDGDGKYRVQVMSGSTLSAAWKNHYTLSDAEAARIANAGINFRVAAQDGKALVYIDKVQVATLDLSKVVATGKDSGIADSGVRIQIRMDGNLGQEMEIPFELVDTATRVVVNIDELSNGTVTADRMIYQLGDTVILTVAPNSGYSQKLYINGQPLKLDWKTNTYSFEATEKVYNITGSFEPSLNIAALDANRWDFANQAHGILNAYYPSNDDAWWTDISGEYTSITVSVKNYLSKDDTHDGNGKVGFSVTLRATIAGKTHAFRIYNDKGTYAYSRSAASGAVSGWSNWKALDEATANAISTGVPFTLERTGGNTLTLSVNGIVVDTYTIAGVTEADKITALGVQHHGNKGQKIEIPFEVKLEQIRPYIKLNIAAVTNGTVTADKANYKVGDTVKLTVTPDAGFAQQLYINGQPLKLDWKTNTYSFVATEEIYNITGSFVPALNVTASDAARWDFANQAHGVVTACYPSNNDSWWAEFAGNYKGITVKAKNYMSMADSYEGAPNGGGFRIVLRATMDNGKNYAFSIWITTDKVYAYNHFGGGGSATGWGGAWALLSEKNAAAIDALHGDGADFKLERIDGNHFQISINGTVLETYTIEGVTEDNKVVSMGMQHNGNKGQKVELPFTLDDGVILPSVQLNIAELTNGTVTADKENYKVGDTVKLTVSPAQGYAQKLYINGQPLKLDWKTNTYSFEATEKVYNITGSFEPSLNIVALDANRWDFANQAHGVVNTYYPSNNDSWWADFTGDYKSLSVVAKNHMSMADSYEGAPNGGGFRIALRATMDNGKNYAFSIWITTDKVYAYNHFGGGGSATGWGGAWALLSEKNPAAIDAINGAGANFKLERIDGNHFQISINGTVLETYTIEGVTEDNKVVSMGVVHYGNKNRKIEIPYQLTTAEAAADVQLNIAAVTNGTVTADKESYKIGDTVRLTVTPAQGFAQQLYINGKPLKLDWKTNTYSFEATEEIYNITGNFVPALNIAALDANRWDFANQAHGILNAYYPSNDDAWWTDISGEYTSITVSVKNYLSKDDTHDGNGKVGFSVTLRATIAGKTHAFRIYNDKGTYAYSRSAASGAVSGWSNWKALDEATANAISTGVPFTLERTGGNTLTLSVNGIVVDTYTIAGVTSADKITALGVQHHGNKGQKIEIPFEVKIGQIIPDVQLNIAAVTNGTVTADKESYKVGDTVKLTVTPDAGFAQQLYINGQPLKLDWKTNTYSFVATEETYNITGNFVYGLSIAALDANRWDFANQAHGILNAYYPANDDAWWTDISGDYASIAVSVKNYLPKADTQDGNGKVGFSVTLRATMDNGKTYAFRIYNDKGTYAYSRSAASGSVSGWSNWKALDEATANAISTGVLFKLERTAGNTFTLSINGTVVDTYTIEGVTEANKIVSMGVQHHGNRGQKIEIPFTMTRIPTVKLNIAELTNGTVTADKASYKVGDTVKLTVTPDEGFAQQLYINGQPLKLDWKTNTYSFKATEETYNITGNFVYARGIVALDANRWDFANQAHGVVTAYYPSNNDSWWADFSGNYKSISVVAKNHMSMADSYEGAPNGGGFRIVLRATMDNGKNYAFSIWITTDKVYAYNHFGGGGSATGWGGAWALLSEKNPAAIDAINGAGANFKLERIDGNHFQISINGTVLETYTIEGVTEANKVVSMGVAHYGNKTTKVEIPFVLG